MVAFDQARADPALRQAFLDDIYFDSIRHKISGLQYEGILPQENCLPQKDYAHAYTISAITFATNSAGSIIREEIDLPLPRIVVRDTLFTGDTACAGDIFSAILDHEIVHVEQFSDSKFVEDITRIRLFMRLRENRTTPSAIGEQVGIAALRTTLEAIIELPAYEAQLTGPYASFMSPEMLRTTRANRDYYRSIIHSVEQDMLRSPAEMFTAPNTLGNTTTRLNRLLKYGFEEAHNGDKEC